MKSPIISSNESPKRNLQEKTNTNISNNNNNTNIYMNPLSNKSGIFFNGMHHGREPVSMMMNIYLILHLLSLPKSYLHLFLSSTNIYFVPIINIDAYKYNSHKYLLTNSLKKANIRKNRRPNKTIHCSEDNLGVDLNRNYDYFFAENNKGSSDSPCDEEYRGEYPFSEPETNNIKNFVDSHPDIKITYNYHAWGNLIITPFNHLKKNKSLEILKNEYPIHYKMYQDFKNEAKYPENFLFGNADNTIYYLSNGDATDWLLGKKKILSFNPELGNGRKDSDIFYPNKNITFEVLQKNLNSALYGIQKSMFYLKIELIKAEYSPCIFRSRYNDIYLGNRRSYNDRDNLRDFDLNYCFIDDIILKAKIKMTNHGFGTYIPGIEFNYNNYENVNNTNSENINNKKYFYFLSLDLKVNIDNIKSICYWSEPLNITNNDKNNTLNQNNETQNNFNSNIRCANNKGNELYDMKVFIDNEIKSLESIIINIQIILKEETFIERKNNTKNKKTKRFLENVNNNNTINNSVSTNITNMNDTNDLIWLYTKKERIIKSENLNGEKLEWKFNAPSLVIKFDDFKKNKNIGSQIIIIKQNPYRFLIYMIFSTSMMIYFICRILKLMNLRNLERILYERGVINRNNNNGRQMRLNINRINVVDNYENINHYQNRNNDHANGYQIARDDSEYSNSDSP